MNIYEQLNFVKENVRLCRPSALEKKQMNISYTVTEYKNGKGWEDKETFSTFKEACKCRDAFESRFGTSGIIYQVWSRLEDENGNIEGDCLIDGRK